MYRQPPQCPNPDCPNHTQPPAGWYVKNGGYRPHGATHPVPRYKCKACGKRFSAATAKPTYYAKVKIGSKLFQLLVSGVSLRRAATLLGVTYPTVVKHFGDLAAQIQTKHRQHLQTIQTGFVQVDELETFLHARAKALSVPMVIRVKTGEILGFAVAKMPAKGKLAQIGQEHYQWTTDERSRKFQLMFHDLKGCFKPKVRVKCDSHSSYPKWITSQVKDAVLDQVLSSKKKPKGEYDELFAINNTFARMRHDMNRLGRKTWSTTKSIAGLENHIWLYVAWNNKYKIQ